jgi:uncharacterized RDD family membrane protein YckC
MDETRSAVNWVGGDVVSSPFVWREPLATTWTPEYAGFWRRFFAQLVDGIVLVIPFRILDSGMERILAENEFNLVRSLMVMAAWIVAYIVVPWLYVALQLSSVHQATLGKRALGIVVTDLKGGRISFGRATGRYFADYISTITLMIGYLIQPFTAKRQALHDIIAKTLVVRR